MDIDRDQRNEFKISLEEAKHKLMDLKKFHTEMMKEGVDYGNLPNTSKKCLFKPGAEKLCSYYGFSIQFELMDKAEDYENRYMSYMIKVILINKCTGIVEAEGIGSCNNYETKYKKQDVFNLANTILKMAKKRAFVDAVLLATRSSDIFTQDIEDDPILLEGNIEPETKERDLSTKPVDTMASPKQLNYIDQLIAQKRMTVESARDQIHKRYGKRDKRDLNKREASEFIEYLRAC